jgi:hypothetical protein
MTQYRRIGGEPATDEDTRALATALRTCAVAEVVRRALLVRVTRLPRDLTRPHHLRLIRAALEPLAGADRARVFRLEDENLVVIWRGEGRALLYETMQALKLLLADLDKHRETSDPRPDVELTDIVVLLELPAQIEIVLQAIEDSTTPGKPRSFSVDLPPPPPPLDAATLELLERALAHVDVARFVRRKPVCSVLRSGEMRVQWEKRYLSIAELTSALIPEYSAQADHWLFRRLTRSLDRRMLALLSDPDELRLARPFGLNMNVSSILSPEFLKFDENVPSHLRGELLLAVLPADVLSDPATFNFARNFTRERGYRLILRGLTADLLAVFPRALLGVDLLQLAWSPELAKLPARLLEEAAGDPKCVLLGRVDHSAALDWGLAQGIGLFQGALIQPSLVDSLPPPVRRRRFIPAGNAAGGNPVAWKSYLGAAPSRA